MNRRYKMLESKKSQAERLIGKTRGEYFKTCLAQSNKVVRETCNSINDYCAEWSAVATDDVVPTANNLHPPDMIMTKRNSAITHKVEVKRDARSRDTGNIFFEARAISEAVADGCDRMFFWVDGLGSYLWCDLEKLHIWLQNQSIYHKANAGDGKVFGGKVNNGWAIPIKKFVDRECPSARVGPIAPLWCDARKIWTNKKYLPKMNDTEFQKYMEDFYNSPQTPQEKMVVDFASIFWNEKDKSWSEVSKIIANKL